MKNSLTQYTELFAQYRQVLEQNAAPVLNNLRDAALNVLNSAGLPTAKSERYRYCDVQKLLEPDYGLNIRRVTSGRNLYRDFRCAIPKLEADLFHTENDVPVLPPDYDVRKALASDVCVVTLRQASDLLPEIVQQHLHSLASQHNDGLMALNTLLSQDGWLVYAKGGSAQKHTVQVVNTATGRTPMMMNRRLLVIAEPGASLDLILCDRTDGDAGFLSTQVTEVVIGEGADVKVSVLDETNQHTTRFSNLLVRQDVNSRFTLNELTLGSGQSRSTTDVLLAGGGAYVELNGTVIADGSQLADHNIEVVHAVGGCQSDMLYKYVLGDSSVGAFAGKVLVRQDAQQTISQQTNANLCTSDTARAFSQPMLEIYADDVKCNHGSTVGKLDEAALLYMRQRGIEENEARLLLQHAFVNEVLERIDLQPLRDRLSHLVEQKFRGRLGKRCKGCDFCG